MMQHKMRVMGGRTILLAACLCLARAQTTLPVGSALLPSTSCPASSVTIGTDAFTVPCALVVTYTLSTAPSNTSATSPQWIGINSGHNNDPRHVQSSRDTFILNCIATHSL